MAELQTHCRWMIARDLPEVVAICAASRGSLRGKSPAATGGRFLSELRKRSAIVYVAEDRETDRVAGYMAYRQYGDHLHLTDLAVRSGCRRNGVGLWLLRKLASKLDIPATRRTRLTAYVPSNRIAMCELLKAAGWRCVGLDGGLFVFEFETGAKS